MPAEVSSGLDGENITLGSKADLTAFFADAVAPEGHTDSGVLGTLDSGDRVDVAHFACLVAETAHADATRFRDGTGPSSGVLRDSEDWRWGMLPGHHSS
jgi:hypothetical protein